MAYYVQPSITQTPRRITEGAQRTENIINGVVFFFQAEDGIRDLIVTGVQTCALPISPTLERRGNGLDSIPLPISTPGFDVAPYTTLSQFITKDPDTGVQNMGNYRGQEIGRASCRERV